MKLLMTLLVWNFPQTFSFGLRLTKYQHLLNRFFFFPFMNPTEVRTAEVKQNICSSPKAVNRHFCNWSYTHFLLANPTASPNAPLYEKTKARGGEKRNPYAKEI